AASLPDRMNGSIRLYVPLPLTGGDALPVSAPQAHYLATVMRRSPGDAIRVFNGRDGEYAARIDTLGRQHTTLRLERQLRPHEADRALGRLFALLKRDATDLVVQKATELGVSELHPLITDRCNTHRMNENRLNAIAIEAAEQSERLTVPIVHPPQTLEV